MIISYFCIDLTHREILAFFPCPVGDHPISPRLHLEEEGVPCNLYRNSQVVVGLAWIWALLAFECDRLSSMRGRTLNTVPQLSHPRPPYLCVGVIFCPFLWAWRRAYDCTNRGLASRAGAARGTWVLPFCSSNNCRLYLQTLQVPTFPTTPDTIVPESSWTNPYCEAVSYLFPHAAIARLLPALERLQKGLVFLCEGSDFHCFWGRCDRLAWVHSGWQGVDWDGEEVECS